MLKKQGTYQEMKTLHLIREYGYFSKRLGAKALQPMKEVEFENEMETIEKELLSRLKRGRK